MENPESSTNEWITVQGVKIRRHAEWQALESKELVAFENYNSGGGAGGYNNEYRLKLCPNGELHAWQNEHTSMYVDGMNYSGASEDSDTGTWDVYEDETGNLFFRFVMKKSGEGYAHFVVQDGKVMMNGRAYHVQPCSC